MTGFALSYALSPASSGPGQSGQVDASRRSVRVEAGYAVLAGSGPRLANGSRPSGFPRTLNSMGNREWHLHETRVEPILRSHAILFLGTLFA